MQIINRPSPNYNSRNGKEPTIILIHYTGMQSEEEALIRLCDPHSQVSAHYTINRDGQVYQHVEAEQRAWHAGQSFWRGETDINSVSIGIELVNKGHEFGYEEFPREQVQALIDLCQQIQDQYDIEFVLAHSDVAPTRKEDPGEKFPWDKLAENGVGVWPQDSNQSTPEIDIKKTLALIGYDISDFKAALTAFQRHFVSEVFDSGQQAEETSLTKTRLQALLEII